MYYYKFVKVVYEEIAYKNKIFVSGKFLINLKTYLFW
jgi:hypothetical protein